MGVLAQLRRGRGVRGLVGCLATLLAAQPAAAADLPITCAAGVCNGGPSTWVTSGAGTLSVDGAQMTIQQQTQRALFNWAEFNIGADSRVRFEQPDVTSVAINRIFQDRPSQIFGRLDANGQVYLINPNGILFGDGAQVNTGGLIASSLQIAEEAVTDGILSPALFPKGKPAFESDGRVFVLDGDGNVVVDADGQPIPVQVSVAAGARLSSNADGGGRVALLGQDVSNAGEISAPAGQAIIAAGEKVYLKASDDAELRGLLVEVDAGGTAWNRLTGRIDSDFGNVTLVGLAVNQDGRVSATTSVSANGSIRLLARDTVDKGGDTGDLSVLQATQTGALRLGEGSLTEILPDGSDGKTAVDEQAQPESLVELMGHQVEFAADSTVRATGGRVAVKALADPRIETPADANQPDPLPVDPDARIRIADGALIDVSGATASVPVSRNLVEVELRANELKDSPLQRDGALRGETVVVDIREGTPLADISGAAANLQRDVVERSATGGTVSLQSQGDVVLAAGATVDVSGGAVNYTPGTVQTSRLITNGGETVSIGQADPDRIYVGVQSPTYTTVSDKWGTVRTVATPGIGRYDPGYVEGRDAGTVQFVAPGLIIDGVLLGRTVNGPLQRTLDSRALGGNLIIGDPAGQGLSQGDYRAPNITIVNELVPTALGEGEAFPAGLDTLQLAVDYLAGGGFTRTSLYSNGRIGVDADLQLLPGSRFAATAARVDLAADVAGPGGTLALTAVNVNPVFGGGTLPARVAVADGVTVDLGGTWVNDNPLLAGLNPQTAVPLDGGSLDLRVLALNGVLQVGADVRLDVDAGAWLKSTGRVVAGQGGSISLAATGPNAGLATGAGLSLGGYGLNGGGRLSIAANQLLVSGDGPAFATAASGDPATGLPYTLSASVFRGGGFQSYALTGVGEQLAGTSPVLALAVADDTQVTLQAERRRLVGDFARRASGTAIEALTVTELAPLAERLPTNLSLAIEPNEGVSFATTSPLRIGAGAVIQGDPGATLSLESVTSIDLAGVLQAPAGAIRVLLDNPPEGLDLGYDPDLGVFLAATARLDVTGTTVLKPSDLGLRLGEVLDGGSIDIRANRGAVNLADGAVLDASGTAAMLDVPRYVLTTGDSAFERRSVASAGGRISLVAPETIRLDGSVRAAGGSAGAPGGSLAVGLSRLRGFSTGTENLPTFPATPRRMELAGVATGAPAQNGVARLSLDAITAGGFADLSLQADAEIRFVSDAALELPGRLVLESPVIGLDAGVNQVSLAGAGVALGPRLLDGGIPSALPAEATGGPASLVVTAGVVDLFGRSVVQGADGVSLEATADIRGSGLNYAAGLAGSFAVAGDLDLRAARVMPTSYSDFGILSTGADASLRVLPGDQAPGRNLSAGGRLYLQAANIEHTGTLVAPLGQIDLTATAALTLGPGSLTSTSGAGAVIPFGRVLNGEQWTYTARSGTFDVITTPPDKRVGLSADLLTVADGAVVDVAGGGDLYAYEFVPGPGGSVDALAPGVNPNLYAILPDLGSAYGAFDTQEYRGAGLQPGDSVTLGAIPGLVEAGTYALLPARYALLPGALLVELRPEIRDLATTQVVTLADGVTPVVGGVRTVAGSGQADSRSTGFAVRPGDYARELAEYLDYRGSDFFAAQAAARDAEAPLLAGDAGQLSLIVGQQLVLAGVLQAAAADGGRGARVDVSADQLLVVTEPVDPPAGVVAVRAAALTELGAESLLLGGRRELTDQGTLLTPVAASVRVDDGVSLAGAELLLVGRETVTLGAGSTLRSTGTSTAPRELILDDAQGGALLGVTTAGDLRLARTTGAGSGDLLLEAGAMAAADGSVLADAGGLARSFGDLATTGQLTLGAGRVVLGADQADITDGLALNNTQLQELADVAGLRFNAATELELRGVLELGAAGGGTRITLDTPLLRGVDADVSIRAASLELRNDRAAAAGDPASGTGLLRAEVDELRFAGGDVAVADFASLAVAAADSVRATADSTLRAAADLAIATPATLGDAGTTLSILAPGQVVAFSGATAPSTAPAAGLGAALLVQGGQVSSTTAHRYPSGLLRLEGVQGVSLGAGALLDVSGLDLDLGGAMLATPGGRVELVSGSGAVTGTGAVVDATGAAGGGDAGSLGVFAGGSFAWSGDLLGNAAGAARGGAVAVYADSLADAPGLFAGLAAGGFTDAIEVETRSGDLALASDQSLTARRVVLAASGGQLTVAGAISTGGARRGSVTLASRDDLQLLAGARVDAAAAAAGDAGGDVSLISTGGDISTAAGASLSLAGGGAADGGRLVARAAATADDLRIADWSATVTGAGETVLEPVQVATPAGDLDAGLLSQLNQLLGDFVSAAAGNIRSRLGLAGTTAIRPAAELQLAGDTQLVADWDLVNFRYADGSTDDAGNSLLQPGSLTIRSAGNLGLQGNLSDAIRTVSLPGIPPTTRVEQADGASWSYTLAAGADAASALPWAVAGRGLLDAADTGSLSLFAGKAIRTGTGDITLAAAGDIVLQAASSVIYTAGLAALPPVSQSGFGGSFTKNWARDGGDIRLLAGRDLAGVPTSQLNSDWIVRTSGAGQVPPTEWAPDIGRFAQGVAALGGGDILASAGRDILNLSLTVPVSGAERAASPGIFDTWGGGNVEATAGRDVRSGVFSTWAGEGRVRAGRDIREGRNEVTGAGDFATLLVFADGAFQLTARRDLELESVLNPTAARPRNGFPSASYFWTLGEADRLDLLAIGGDLGIANNQAQFSQITGQTSADSAAFAVYPGTVNAFAPAGDLSTANNMLLLPDRDGGLQLVAGRDLAVATVSLSDVAPELLPRAANPAPSAGGAVAIAAPSAADAIHAGNTEPTRLVAATGDVLGGAFLIPEAVRMQAGRDIRNVLLRAQNNAPGEVTQITAGRDFVQEGQSLLVDLAGPGQLQLLAGRNVDLGFSGGVTTSGRTRNGNIPVPGGADLQIWAGLGAEGPDYAGFNQAYLVDNDAYQDALEAFVAERLGGTLTGQAALDAYLALDVDTQRPFILQVYYSELREAGREFTAGTDTDYTRGFAAVDALFPDGRAYAGDLELPFSRVYTLAGGDVSLQVPAGLINVGLATPPTTANPKSPSELGIVAQGDGDVQIFTDGDVLVNQSRVFTLKGGDIVIWSSAGDIDAGRGAKSAISAPEPVITADAQGNIQVQFADAIAGSGIRGILTDPDIEPGDVDLIAPTGEVNAGDAGIGSAGNLNIAAPRVVGLDNIQVAGISSGVPADAGGVAAALSGVSSLSSSATKAAEASTTAKVAAGEDEAPLARAALGWLELFVEGFGDEDDDDKDKDKRNDGDS